MAVDIGNVLHVLAHELRTPAGIAQGYIRMLIEGELTDEADRHRALEQTQKALKRMSDLSREATTLATWCERDPERPVQEISTTALLNRIAQLELDPPVVVRSEGAVTSGTIATMDQWALQDAVTTMVRVTARELRGGACTVRAVAKNAALELWIGPDDRTPSLAGGPKAAGAAAVGLERGGVGLAMVQATLVLEAHDATCWTVGEARDVLGIRLPLRERATT